MRDQQLFMNGRAMQAAIHGHAALRADDRMKGPAVICEMDSTTPIHVGHVGDSDDFGCLLLQPD